MTIYVVRHGRTEYNDNHLYCGRADVPLAAAGIEQLPELAAKARTLALDAVISSPLRRAVMTASAAADACGLRVVTDDRLIERDFGDMEGKDFDIEVRDALYWRNFAYHYPNGESFFQVVQRVYNCIDDIRANYRGKTVMIVAHGVVCRAIATYMTDMTNDEFYKLSFTNCSITKYEI